VDVIRALAEHGANINTPNQNGSTPINVAAYRGHVGAMRTLAELRADINTANNKRATPVYMAAQEGNVEVIRALAEHGADLNTPAEKGFTPVYSAAYEGHVDAIKVLVAHGANVNTPTGDGGTPVLVAAQEGRTDVIKLLYKLGANMKPDSAYLSMKQLAQLDENNKALQLIDKILAKMTRECECCGSSSKRLKVCSNCEMVRYCSRQCQVQDYKKHKKECHVKVNTTSEEEKEDLA
jgi:ankyrin repeat protein